MNNTVKWLSIAGLAAGVLAGADVRTAEACGCFTPPDPTVPVVQAGERILFGIENGQVTAHIQIQYAGSAGEFGWLLPLPSIPKLELGTDEVFAQLIAQTQPKYRMTRVFNGQCGFANGRNFGGPGSPAPQAGGAETDANGDGEKKSPLVLQASVGPYDYAVLHADEKKDMLDWLAKNRYFVPVGTDDAVGPYIRPGSYFLALKLRPGNSTGDLQPVVVRYASDLPMIPIILSSVASQRNMGIQVWMLGSGRAIPRNFHHTVINDAAVDWITSGQNYNDVIIRAAGEAPGHHTFVTEYAGTSNVMKNILNFPGRFGAQAELASIHDPALFTQYMQQHGYPFNGQVVAILQRSIPFPSGIEAMKVTAAQYYQLLSYYLGAYRKQNPGVFERYDFSGFDSVVVAAELNDRIAKPTLEAGALFDTFSYLTRLYTTLSPEDMNRDPVFSFNSDLPGVPNVHEATLTYECGLFGSNDQNATYAWLKTADGFVITYPSGTGGGSSAKPTPASRRIEILREAGVPEVLTDNTGEITGALGGGGGCSVRSSGTSSNAQFALLLLGLGALLAVRRRQGRK
ncbi:MAG: DUF2330 domain-containing protein [Myxococcales bacterium]|nr:DUF2330 domain-containing protein [Myxococcales bacterium]